MKKEPAAVRFLRHFEKLGPDDCWPWLGSTIKRGYGHFQDDDGKVIGAHVFAFKQENGPVPEGKIVCHSCDNPPCVNPGHLFAGTHGQNMQDMKDKMRSLGIEKPSRRTFRYLSDKEEAVIVELLKDGASVSAIADQFRVNRKTIRNVRTRAGLQPVESKYTPRRFRG